MITMTHRIQELIRTKAVLAGAFLISLTLNVSAQSTWTATGTADWNTPGNWSAGIPGVGVTADVGNTDPGAPLVITYNAPMSAASFGALNLSWDGGLTSGGSTTDTVTLNINAAGFTSTGTDFVNGLGTINVNSGGVYDASGALTIGTYNSYYTGAVNVLGGGSLTVGGLTTIQAGSLNIAASSTLANVILSSSNVNDTLAISGGTNSIGIINDDRDNAGKTTATGVVVTGGTTTASEVLLGTTASWGNMYLNGSAASFTVSGGANAFILGEQTSSGRGGSLVVNAGTLNYADTTTGLIVTDANSNVGVATFSGGTANLGMITLLGSGVTSGATNATTSTVTLSGGTVYIGSGGIVEGSTPGASVATINLNSGILGASAAWSSTLPMTLGGTITIQTANSSATAENIGLSGPLSGTGSLTETGGGNLTLSGTNTYSGVTTVSSGTLVVGNNLALQDSTLSTSGAGVVTVTGFTTPTIGGLTGSTALASVITTGYGSVTNLTLNPGASVSDTYSGVIANGANGMSLTMSGAGTQILSGTNTYTGTTTINSGILEAGNNNSSALGAGTSIVLNGGTLALSAVIISQAISVTSASTISDVTGTSNGVLNGAVTGSATLNFSIPNSSLISIGNGASNPLSGFTGLIELGSSVGSVRFNLVDTATTYSSTAAWDLGTGSATLYTRNGQSTIIQLGSLAGGASTVLEGASNNNQANNSATYSIGGANTSTTFAGKIEDGTAGTANDATTAITKVGTGSLTVSGANTYTGGTTVNAGSLLVNNTSGSGTGTGSVSVASAVSTNAVLGGSGKISGAVTVGSGSLGTSFLFAGAGGTPSNLTLSGGVTLSSNSGLEFKLNTSGMASSGQTVFGLGNNSYADLLSITGGLSLGSNLGTLTLSDTGTSTPLTVGDVIVLATTSTGVTGALSGYANGSTVAYGANDYQINYGTLAGYSNDLTLEVTAVPEPSTWVMMVGGLALLVLWRRRKNTLV